jgi:hypothetical protein
MWREKRCTSSLRATAPCKSGPGLGLAGGWRIAPLARMPRSAASHPNSATDAARWAGTGDRLAQLSPPAIAIPQQNRHVAVINLAQPSVVRK